MGDDNNKMSNIKDIQKILNLQQDGIIGKQTLHHFKRFKTIKRKFTIIKILNSRSSLHGE